jgi:hypothetical protein
MKFYVYPKIVTARHRAEMETLHRLWIATIKEMTLKKERKREKGSLPKCEIIEAVSLR